MILIMSLFAGTFAFAGSGRVVIVDDGKANAAISIAKQASSMVVEAAELLQTMVKKSSGVKLRIVKQGDKFDEKIIIRLVIDNGGDKLDKDGFVISSPAQNTLEIKGGSESGVLFGVQELLERYLGVRWLIPGDLGEHVPPHSTIAIPRDKIRQEPAFFSRQLSGSLTKRQGPQRTFLIRQRMHGRVNFHHNLSNLYSLKYATNHPIFFPVINGKRYIPASARERWQPELNADGIIEEGTNTINKFFNRNPHVESYSLGMNDSGSWSDSAIKSAGSRRNSVGLPDLSDYYFRWANKIAEGVHIKHPGKFFGCLAYRELLDPPTKTKLNPYILPFVCYDRMFWLNPDMRRRDMERTRNWNKVAERLAWYDYVYGGAWYKLPRFYPHLMAEYLRFAHNNKVVAYYAEAYPIQEWIEGPKFYLLLRLLWNPDLDVDVVLDEWCRAAVGEKSAQHLKKYYKFCEDFWTSRIPKTKWFKGYIGETYLSPKNYDYADVTAADIKYCEELMQNVVKDAESETQKARAKFFYDGWKLVRKNLDANIELNEVRRAGGGSDEKLERVFFATFEDKTKTVTSPGGKQDDWSSFDMPPGWSFWQRRGKSFAKFGWDQETGYESRKSLTVDVDGSHKQPMSFMRTVKVEPNKLYKLSCMVRASGISDEGKVGIRTHWRTKNNKGKWVWASLTKENIKVTHYTKYLKNIRNDQWQPLEMYVRSPDLEQIIVTVTLCVDNVEKGKVWFDNVRLNRVITDTK